MRIAVIGSGISGLACALHLSQKYDVRLFESSDRAGGHANTILVKDENNIIPVDTGFIVFNEEHYPLLTGLFNWLKVESQNSDMSFSVCCEKTGFEYSGSNLNSFFSQRSNIYGLRSWKILYDIFRFNEHAKKALKIGIDDDITVSDFALRHNYSQEFIDYYLLPLGGALWSCAANKFRNFPIKFVLDFLNNHSMLQVIKRPTWRTVVQGSREYVSRISSRLGDRLYLNKEVAKVARMNKGIEIRFSDGTTDNFEEVVLATHADTSLHLNVDADPLEVELLSAFPYHENIVSLHTDTSLLPKFKRTWASWNYRLKDYSSGQACVTYNMNKLQNLKTQKTYCVSLNQHTEISPKFLIKEEVVRHPTFMPNREYIQSHHKDMIRRRGISYCGAYWGFGFHEDGIRSAMDVSKAFDVGSLF